MRKKDYSYINIVTSTVQSFISTEKYDVQRFRKGVFGMIGFIYFYGVDEPDRIVISPNNFEYEAVVSGQKMSIIGEYLFGDVSHERLTDKIQKQISNTFYDADTNTELNRIGSSIRMLNFTFSHDVMKNVNLATTFNEVPELHFQKEWENLKDALLDEKISKIR